MNRPLHIASLCYGLLLLPLSARAGPEDSFAAGQPEPSPGASAAEWEDQSYDVEPVEAPPPEALVQPRAPAATPAGEWVDTQQYGRIWMPYSDAYTSMPPDGWGEPYQYIYGPAYGWTWVAAPWIWGWGPWPTFGFYGPRHFGWYGHGWWRTPSRWHYAPAARPGGFDRGGWQGPHRGGWVAPQRGPAGGRPWGAPGFRSSAPGFRGTAPAHRGFSSPGGGGRAGGHHR